MSKPNVQATEVAEEVVDRDESPAAAPESTSAIVEYTKTELGLADLRQRYAGVQFDLTTTKGNDAARAARLELKTLRTSLEAKRKEVKAPLLERAALVDAEAKRIASEIVALEDPIDAQIKADEQRRAVEKAAREQAERERVAAIRERIAAIAPPTDGLAAASSEVIAVALKALIDVEISEELFGEFIDEAQGVKMRADAMLCSLLRVAEGREAAAAELERQREEMARTRAELEARLKAQAEEHARQQAEIQARAAAELQRIADERAAHEAKLKAEREAHERQVAAERAQAQAQADAEAATRERAAAAERQRLADEKVAAEARSAELKRQEDAFAEEKRIATKKLEDERAEMERRREADLAVAELAANPPMVAPESGRPINMFDVVQSDMGVILRDISTHEQLADQATGVPPVMVGGQLSMVEAAGGSTRPSDDEILDLLVDTFGVSPSEALEWLTHFDIDAQVSRLKVAA